MGLFVEKVENMLEDRKEQLFKESPESYNHGYVAGEVSGSQRAIEKIKEAQTENVIKELKELLKNRENQLDKESPGSYNHGYVAGEVGQIRKVINKIEI